MSDQQQASGESSTRAAETGTPDADAVAAQLSGAGASKPPTASTSEGTDAGKAAASEPEAGADPAPSSTPSAPDADADAEKAGSGPAKAGKPEAEAGAKGEAGAKAEPEAEAKTGENAQGATGSSEGEAASGSGTQAVSAAATREQHEAVAIAAIGKNTAVSTRSAVGTPRKPVLAGAALAGAILIAVPLLITVTDRDEERKNVDNTASDTVLNEAGGPAGVFETQTPSPSESEPEKKKEKKAAPVAAPPVAEEAAAPAPKPSPSPSKKKAATKKAPSTLPAVMTRVLIKNNTNGTCVDIPGFSSGRADGPVTHATCNSNTDDNQLWNVEKRYDKAGPGGVPLFQIRNVMDSMCLDLPGYKGVGGATKVTEFPCNGTTNDNQLWWLDKQSDGRFWIRNAASNNQCLDSYANDDSTRDLIIWPCAPEGQNNHEWIFTRS
ncbi:RICIN domain-containing protein [Streptomyces sp. BH-SS-21]|uniref:RICIN domain-containing protein n=1 Tax=Streptomyces liliiviolaceus TaxID=2823109 RepID=A0A941B9R5_9ACTN|nr:RICIN domain-containing protein [Streptomyces liliiviolaceus]MBQ0852057.1 RICIN domain-containing protein [Streptomyces liliiviolaceus]